MRKNFHFICVLLLVVCSRNTQAQVFQGLSYDELIRSAIEMQIAHEKADKSIDELYDYVGDFLGRDIDNQLRQELNTELKTLDAIAIQLSKKGISASIINSISASRRRIQKSIADYNNRVAKYREDVTSKKNVEPDNWSGTGFALKDGFIVTNYHVVDGAKTIYVSGVNGIFSIEYKATVITADRYSDLAIVKIDDDRFNGFGNIPYSIKTGMADVGEDVFVLGYPLITFMGDEIKLTTGVISSRTGFQGDVTSYQISAPIQPGNSGGPLFDNKGNLIGIVNAKISAAENVGYAIKTSYLTNLVESFTSSSILPSVNSVSSLSRPSQIKSLRNYVFLLKCSRSETNTSTSYTTNIYSAGSSPSE